jgi:hypothetical protein
MTGSQAAGSVKSVPAFDGVVVDVVAVVVDVDVVAVVVGVLVAGAVCALAAPASKANRLAAHTTERRGRDIPR